MFDYISRIGGTTRLYCVRRRKNKDIDGKNKIYYKKLYMFNPHLELSVLFDLKKNEKSNISASYSFAALFQTDYAEVWHSRS